MQIIIDTTSESIKQSHDNMESPRSPSLSGMPVSHNPQAGEATLVEQLDRLSVMERRYDEAKFYMDWFEPCWKALTEQERRILDEFYLNGGFRNGARHRLAAELSFSVRHINRLRGLALARLQLLLFG